MDITSMLSSDDAPVQQPSQSPTAQRNPASSHGPSGTGIRPPPPPPLSRHSSQHAAPQHWSPASREFDSPSALMSAQRSGLTSLQTESLSGQHFPLSHASHSVSTSAHPNASPGGLSSILQYHQPPPPTPQSANLGLGQNQQHTFSATTPSRPPSLPLYQHSQQQYTPNPHTLRQHTSSSSPTPSHHSQASHGMYQSPHLSTSHLPPQQASLHLQHQQSQPSTPLGPPSLNYSRPSASLHSIHLDSYNPLPQRSLSSTSNGVTGGSPAQQFSRNGQLARHPSEQSQQAERERSLSVSPKTIVPVPMTLAAPVSLSLKRAAEEADPAPAPPMKRVKKRPTERPIWARLAPGNPRYDAKTNGSAPANGHAPVKGHPNGTTANGASSKGMTDEDLAHARKVLGGWERSFQGRVPIPNLHKYVQDWLWFQLSQHNDIGLDPSEGVIEIEAKIGTLISADTGKRANQGVATMCVIPESANARYKFESQMALHEYQAMNQLLNDAVIAAQAPHREPIVYKRIEQTDSFQALTPAGVAALPPSLQNRSHGRPPKMRTSTDAKSGRVKDRITKINLSNLHIHNPSGPYDCRISINLEVNLLARIESGELHLDDLIEGSQAAGPSRHKNRMNYKHLAYDIDLTCVTMTSSDVTYELELEVDATVLRQQMQLLTSGEPSAYGDIVSGFLENASFLMSPR